MCLRLSNILHWDRPSGWLHFRNAQMLCEQWVARITKRVLFLQALTHQGWNTLVDGLQTTFSCSSIRFPLRINHIISHRIASHHITVLYCIVLYCIVSYRIASHRIVSYRIISYYIISLYNIILSCCIVSYHIIKHTFIISYIITSFEQHTVNTVIFIRHKKR